MENQTPQGAKAPFLNIITGVEAMTDAFGISQERYDAMHHLVTSIINGQVAELQFDKNLGDGKIERGIDIAATINYIQSQAQSLTEFTLASFFFGSTVGQLIQRVRDEEEQKFKSGFSIKEAILKAAKESGFETHEIIPEDEEGTSAIAIEIPLNSQKESVGQ